MKKNNTTVDSCNKAVHCSKYFSEIYVSVIVPISYSPAGKFVVVTGRLNREKIYLTIRV